MQLSGLSVGIYTSLKPCETGDERPQRSATSLAKRAILDSKMAAMLYTLSHNFLDRANTKKLKASLLMFLMVRNPIEA